MAKIAAAQPKFTRVDADVRRHSLIAATARCLARDGFDGASVRRICEEAGVSAGLLRHYFDGKDDLVAQTYDGLAADFTRITRDILHGASGGPEERLRAFFEASFTAEFIDADVFLVWVAFWRQVRVDEKIRRSHRRAYGVHRRDLEDILHDIAAQHGFACDPRLAALSLTALMDGLWLEISLDATAFTPAEATAICTNWLDSFIGGGFAGRFN
jgi:TetR/AcrR family transcriptional repressor of bet genes